MGKCWAAAPVLYSQPAYQSPVRGEPDDLLLLAGHGFQADDVVVYRSIANSTAPLRSPDSMPSTSTADSGIVDIVSTANLPYSLTLRLPGEMRSGQTYALWVRTATGEWSDAVQINDARPYWLSPAYVHETQGVASLPRYLKVIGRNLQPASGATTRIRLTGPQTLVLDANASPDSSDSVLSQYAAIAALPKRLPIGAYRVEVSRDGASWVALKDQMLEVRADAVDRTEFSPGDAAYGACRPDDDRDDATCLVRAVAAANKAGGGVVVLGPGTWLLSSMDSLGVDGIVVPVGVGLRGAGTGKTILARRPDVDRTLPSATFTLLGSNVVQDIAFRDLRPHQPTTLPQPFIRLGTARGVSSAGASPVPAVSDVVITHNLFDRVYVGIGDGGASVRRLFVTYNEFGAYVAALRLAGNIFDVHGTFRIDDTIVAHNLFKPGSYLDIPARQGSLASELGAGYRVDFSNNIADGASTDYLDSPRDAPGWRAGFFWHMNGNQEMLLVAQNDISCSGDKVGDGEAIAYDNNGNTFAFGAAMKVLASTVDSVTVAGPLQNTQHDRAIAVDSYYVGHWIQVGEGPGVGQVRRIESYRIESRTGEVTFKVAPAWDVPPAARISRISAGREFRQVYTIANTIDHRQPLCAKSNRSNRKGGGIVVFAQTTDSAIEGNRQFDADGILLQASYNARDVACPKCFSETYFLNFIDVRRNVIDGEYDWNDDCSSSGIFGSLAIAPTPGSPPPVMGYGLMISGNSIRGADGYRGGAIAFAPTWFQGPPPHRWPVVNNLLIDHNTITGMLGGAAKVCGQGRPRARTGISLDGSALVSRTVLYANSCADASQRLAAGWQDVTRVCRQPSLSSGPSSCECRR
jgi:hypothetical protein